MKKLLLAIACAAMLGGGTGAAADNYPSRPITMVVPLGVGGSTDVIARIVAEGMRPTLGQPVIVENTTGAGGTIGVGRVARANPDGYTIGIGQWGTNVASGAIYPLQYDLIKDFEPVALISTQPFLIVAKKSAPANNLQELIAWLKANSSKIAQGNSGIGTPSHVAGLMFQNAIGAHFTMVPYRGAGNSLGDLIGEQIDVMLDTPALSLPQIRGGTIKVYAVTAKTRLAIAPEIPTTDEAGLPGFYFTFWHAIWVPKGTPKEIVTKLNEAVVNALADPKTRQRLTDLAQEIFPRDQQTPDALGAFHKAEIDKWWPIIKAADIKIQ
ncbi:MAG TPA: tripartite tricarboxylate transporter substrate-binding protein [Xanthobacteraceae bacterium]|nr:tripartite tricarboxylate transporter substrate-binding protein [Xanthobacteraceae bacterium]